MAYAFIRGTVNFVINLLRTLLKNSFTGRKKLAVQKSDCALEGVYYILSSFLILLKIKRQSEVERLFVVKKRNNLVLIKKYYY